MNEQPNNPLHGITLERIVRELRDYYGWDQMAYHVNVNCFANNPSLNSSLKFLRLAIFFFSVYIKINL
jgi:uncharacterized protein (DUF2132 family)